MLRRANYNNYVSLLRVFAGVAITENMELLDVASQPSGAPPAGEADIFRDVADTSSPRYAAFSH